MEPWKIIVIVIAALVVILISTYFTIVNVTFGLVFSRFRINREILYGQLFGLRWARYLGSMDQIKQKYMRKKHEDIEITNIDTKLHGYFYEHKKSNKIIIFVHGYYSSGFNDIGVQNDLYEQLGTNLLIVDQRGCGQSGGPYTTFGLRERYDIREWIFYLDQRFKGKKDIYLSGISMGAATVLLTSGLFGLPPSVKGIIADSGYSRPSGIALHTGKKVVKFKPKILFFGINTYCKIFAKFSMNETTVTKEVKKNTRIPVLFIHGTSDDFVPYNMSVKNYKACSAPKQFVKVDNATHCESMRYAPEIVYPAIRKFIHGK